jgi:hypothetical protein
MDAERQHPDQAQYHRLTSDTVICFVNIEPQTPVSFTASFKPEQVGFPPDWDKPEAERDRERAKLRFRVRDLLGPEQATEQATETWRLNQPITITPPADPCANPGVGVAKIVEIC